MKNYGDTLRYRARLACYDNAWYLLHCADQHCNMDSSGKEEGAEPWLDSLRVPAIEVIDLLTDDEEPIAEAEPKNEETRNAYNENDQDSDDQWSMYEDLLNADEDSGESDGCSIYPGTFKRFERLPVADGPDLEAFTLEESLAFRKRLRLIGEDRFIQETVEAQTITAKKLITAFGIRPPPFLEGEPDKAYYTLLGLGICRELSKRDKLPQYNTIDDAVELLKKSCNIIVLTGAGVRARLSFR